jgi:hypothetical protein
MISGSISRVLALIAASLKWMVTTLRRGDYTASYNAIRNCGWSHCHLSPVRAVALKKAHKERIEEYFDRLATIRKGPCERKEEQSTDTTSNTKVRTRKVRSDKGK